MSRVLLVEDENSIRNTLKEFLIREGYYVDIACDAQEALRVLDENNYNYGVVVTDIIMPRMTGIDLLEKIRKKSNTIQIVIMTGEPTVDTAIIAVQNGANDYLVKPISKENIIKSIRHASEIKRLIDEKSILEEEKRLYQMDLEIMIDARTKELKNAIQGTISLISSISEMRDIYTAGHQRRVGNLAAAISKEMGNDAKFIENMRIIGYIHDIGKIVIPAEILAKPGKLSFLEMQMIKEHPQKGYDMLYKVELPPIISEVICQHHERCDGSGYPRGLNADDISQEAKILMVADVVEAMMSHRPYRPALGIASALEEIEKNSGFLYDKDVVRTCIKLFHDINYEIEEDEKINICF
ncbi:MAG: hypothetical protein A2Y17_07530 [Clostridiales bacterium GWF2_38_85]|nr:MAG: hypothetical protein A2Y17_07530 [Clostridiales bacterium GWF2_38_85]HBL84275.1 two-component system response regulator [Clostridiales bacterium]